VFVSLLVEAVNRERETGEISSSPTPTSPLATSPTPTATPTPTPSSNTTSPTHSSNQLPEGWAMQV
jgi:hypothetical protein